MDSTKVADEKQSKLYLEKLAVIIWDRKTKKKKKKVQKLYFYYKWYVSVSNPLFFNNKYSPHMQAFYQK